MDNDSTEISASEINRYVYCHYQWYYERLYGRKRLRELYNARNKALGLDDPLKSNLARGLKFHSSYRLSRRRFVLAAVVIAVIVFILYRYGVRVW